METAPPDMQTFANMITDTNRMLLASVNRPLNAPGDPKLQIEEQKFDYMALSEQQMYTNLREL